MKHSLNAASPTFFIMSKEACVQNGTCVLNDLGLVMHLTTLTSFVEQTAQDSWAKGAHVTEW